MPELTMPSLPKLAAEVTKPMADACSKLTCRIVQACIDEDGLQRKKSRSRNAFYLALLLLSIASPAEAAPVDHGSIREVAVDLSQVPPEGCALNYLAWTLTGVLFIALTGCLVWIFQRSRKAKCKIPHKQGFDHPKQYLYDPEV